MPTYHALSAQAALDALQATVAGLSAADAVQRRLHYGANELPTPAKKSVIKIFLAQFLSPLIYVLLVAALLSLSAGEWLDSVFIIAVLLMNALIGAVQENSAERSAASLNNMITRSARVLREREVYIIDASELVPGDIVLLESGDKVPADLRLLEAFNVRMDEALLSGESLPQQKQADTILPEHALLPERSNMVFSGTLLISGRAVGVVVTTGLQTELGHIAKDVLTSQRSKPPLLVRMEKFTLRLTLFMGVATLLFAAVTLYQGMHWFDVFMLAAALAVAAIPEGLPVAMTVALAISVRRMANRHVIARRLVTVEALGSCTLIASDKTGTLTRNEIVVHRIVLPEREPFDFPQTELLTAAANAEVQAKISPAELPLLQNLALAMTLTNEGFIGERDGEWVKQGDSIDTALLVMAHSLGISRTQALLQYPEVAAIPYESLARFSATLHRHNEDGHTALNKVCVKGALETLLPMCSQMMTAGGDVPVTADAILQQANDLAAQGYRVLAAADGWIKPVHSQQLENDDLTQLRFLGLTGMIDPLREESAAAVAQCHQAGIEVVMVTGDHPLTAYAIGRELKLLDSPQQVVSSQQFSTAMQDDTLRSQMLQQVRVYARMEPHQKLMLVNALQQQGHFVAVTGDGANDAPALRVAHVGVAMGKKGTDVARETADIIITDDNFSSIVAGVEEGRVAYSNVRKVIHLLISTGFAELLLVFMSLLLGVPIPLTAVQLLWLNLVANGIQDVALAFEPGEGNELNKPPRAPQEPIFNRVMIERVMISAVVISTVAMATYYVLLQQGLSVESARNATLLLMVLFANIHVFNSRSESQSVFTHALQRNRFLVFATLAAQGLHIAAMYTPGLRDVLEIAPISFADWLVYLALALSLLLVSEVYKVYYRQREAKEDRLMHANKNL